MKKVLGWETKKISSFSRFLCLPSLCFTPVFQHKYMSEQDSYIQRLLSRFFPVYSFQTFFHEKHNLLSFSGFSDPREFIVAQHPLDHTASSFWQMCWEQQVHLVVALSPLDPQECRPFWALDAGTSVFFDGPARLRVS